MSERVCVRPDAPVFLFLLSPTTFDLSGVERVPVLLPVLFKVPEKGLPTLSPEFSVSFPKYIDDVFSSPVHPMSIQGAAKANGKEENKEEPSSKVANGNGGENGSGGQKEEEEGGGGRRRHSRGEEDRQHKHKKHKKSRHLERLVNKAVSKSDDIYSDSELGILSTYIAGVL